MLSAEQARDTSMDPLVIFTPSGKRGHFPVGTPVLTAARQLGVDLDSVFGDGDTVFGELTKAWLH
ncbi:MAG: hypothetical protein AAGP08_18040, partial [Pseudomonadota bacterium]